LTVEDGNDLRAIERAIKDAQRIKDKAEMIRVKTIIGFGNAESGNVESALGRAGRRSRQETKRNLGWDENKHFYVPKEVSNHFREAIKRGAQLEKDWEALVKKYEKTHGDLGKTLQETRKNKLPEGWEKSLPKFDDVEAKATRAYSGEVINAIADAVPQLIGGSADLAPSNNTTIKSSADFQAGQYQNRNIHFGIREHAMGATMNGMALYGSVIPFGGTFQTFSDYMRPGDSACCSLRRADDFRFHARFNRLGRRRSDASIGRTSRRITRHSETRRHSPVRRARNPRSLARRAS
jgi:transketolase